MHVSLYFTLLPAFSGSSRRLVTYSSSVLDECHKFFGTCVLALPKDLNVLPAVS